MMATAEVEILASETPGNQGNVVATNNTPIELRIPSRERDCSEDSSSTSKSPLMDRLSTGSASNDRVDSSGDSLVAVDSAVEEPRKTDANSSPKDGLYL